MIPGGTVDTHLHLWDLEQFHYPWLNDPGTEELNSNYLVQHWRQDAAGVDIAATVHVQAEMDHDVDPAEETSWLASLAAPGDEDPVPTVCVGYADLRAPALDDLLDRHQRHGLFRGVRQEAWFDPASTRADVPQINLLDDPTWASGLRLLSARHLTFDLLVWPHQLQQAATIVRELPDLRLVLEHTGLPVDAAPDQRDLWRSSMRIFANQVPHAMLKISALRFVSPTWAVSDLDPIVREAVDIFGPERCMFGSNFPVDKPAISYADLWKACDEMTADFSTSERAHMFRENALHAYRIDVSAPRRKDPPDERQYRLGRDS